MIYAIQAGLNGPIKLGYARKPRKRLAELQVAHFERLNLLACEETDGDAQIEQYIHELNAKERIRGEWFKPSPEVLRLVDDMKAGVAARNVKNAVLGNIVNEYKSLKRRAALITFIKVIQRLIGMQHGSQNKA